MNWENILIPQFDFSRFWLSMRSAGVSLTYLFAQFGETFTQPFYETFIQFHFPSLYLALKPVMNTWYHIVNVAFGPQLADIILGPSLLDLIGFAVAFLVLGKLWKAIWDAIPVA